MSPLENVALRVQWRRQEKLHLILQGEKKGGEVFGRKWGFGVLLKEQKRKLAEKKNSIIKSQGYSHTRWRAAWRKKSDGDWGTE